MRRPRKLRLESWEEDSVDEAVADDRREELLTPLTWFSTELSVESALAKSGWWTPFLPPGYRGWFDAGPEVFVLLWFVLKVLGLAGAGSKEAALWMPSAFPPKKKDARELGALKQSGGWGRGGVNA